MSDLSVKIDAAQIVDRVLALKMVVEVDRLFAALIGIPADLLTERRLKRLERLQERRTRKAAILGHEVKALPEKVAYEAINAVAVEDDEDMQELWANLLANFDAGKPINAFLIGLMKNLDGQTAKVLLYFWEKAESVRPEMEKCTSRDEQMQIWRKTLIYDAELYHELGEWAPAERVRLQALDLIGFVVTGTEETYYALEELGHMLCRAVTGPKISET